MRDSANYESGLVRAASNELTEGMINRMERVRNSDYEHGKYLVLPQYSFNVECKFGDDIFSSPRHVIVRVENNKIGYVRTWKVSNYTAMMTCSIEQGIPTMKAVRNNKGLLRLPPEAGRVLSCSDHIPVDITKDSDGHKRCTATEAFFINYQGIMRGFKPWFKQNANGEWDVDVDEDGNVTYQAVSIPCFNVPKETPSESLVQTAKEAIRNDSQIRDLFCGL